MAKAQNKASKSKPATPRKSSYVKRNEHPLVGHADSQTYPFGATPPDFDFAKHTRLRKHDFTADHLYFTYKAEESEVIAADFRDKAEEARSFGTTKERSAARRLVKMVDKLAELRMTLEAGGVNVDEMLERVRK